MTEQDFRDLCVAPDCTLHEALATLNRTAKSLALAKIGAEYVLNWLPHGTHDWNKFLKPDEIAAFLAGEPVEVEGPFGVSYEVLSGRWSLSGDSSVNYMMTVTAKATATR